MRSLELMKKRTGVSKKFFFINFFSLVEVFNYSSIRMRAPFFYLAALSSITLLFSLFETHLTQPKYLQIVYLLFFAQTKIPKSQILLDLTKFYKDFYPTFHRINRYNSFILKIKNKKKDD